MTLQRFLCPRLTGTRFEGCAIPLELLKDIAVLEEMIVEVAKVLFLKANPDRIRSPRGFSSGIELKLTALEDGSATPVISIDLDKPALFPIATHHYFEQARDRIVAAIVAAELNQPVVEFLPEEVLPYFDRFGRSLRDDEAIEFPATEHSRKASLTKETRRRLLLASSRITELTEEASVRGTIPEADQENRTFHVQLLDGRKVRAPIAEQHFDTIIEAFNGYKDGARVLLKGIGRYSRTEKLLGFDSIEHISLLEPLDVAARLDEFMHLKAGWLDGQGEPPSREGLDWLVQTFDQYYPDDLPLPYLYPTLEGGIQAEWSLGSFEVSLAIELQIRTGAWHSLGLDTEPDGCRELNLAEAASWRWLTEQIRKMVADAG